MSSPYSTHSWWQLGLVLVRWSRSTKLFYAGSG